MSVFLVLCGRAGDVSEGKRYRRIIPAPQTPECVVIEYFLIFERLAVDQRYG